MTWTTPSYNLLVEPWIPILWNNGQTGRVGVLEALRQASRIRQIAASNPMDRLAVLRFLLALLYWCRGESGEEASAPSVETFPSEWFSKLEEDRDFFNLLGEGQRFYQVRDAERKRPSTDLIHEIPTGNNFWHFKHSTDFSEGLCPACCILGLLRLPLFSVSGLPNLKAGINGTPPIYAVPIGETLQQTLSMNLVPWEGIGIPAWLRPDISVPQDEKVPMLTGLTLLSRRVFLHEPEPDIGICVHCGSSDQLIRTCEFQTAGDQKTEAWMDPHVIYLDDTTQKALKAPDLTASGKFFMDRPWTRLLLRLAEKDCKTAKVETKEILIIGFSTDKAKYIDVWERIVNLNNGAPTPIIDIWQKESASLARKAVPRKKAAAANQRNRAPIEIVSAVASIRPHVEGKVSAMAGELLAGGDEAWERAADEYRKMMTVVSKSLSPGYTSAAVERRRQIGQVKPDMRPKPEAEKKPGRKKGAGQ